MKSQKLLFKLNTLSCLLLSSLVAHADTLPEMKQTENQELENVVVKGTRNAARYGYIATPNQTTTATKTPTAVQETPNSVSVITRRHLDERAPQDLPSTLAYTSGISRSGYRGENSMIEASVRGVGGDLGGAGGTAYGGTELPHINGMRYFAHLEFNPYLVQNIDVLKGPASVLYGQSNPGGIINIHTKQPTGSNEHEILLTLGNQKHREINIDLDKSLNNNIDYRIVGAVKHNQWRVGENGKYQAYTFAPSIKFHSDDNKTQFTGSVLYENVPKAGERNFLPRKGTVDAYSDGTTIPHNFFAGDPNFNGHNNKKWRLGYEFSHQFNDHLGFKQNVAWGKYRNHMNVLAAVDGARWTQTGRRLALRNGLLGTDEKDIYRESTVWNQNWREFQVDNQFTGQFDSGSLKHRFLVGLDYYKLKNKDVREESEIQYGINSANPVYGVNVFPCGTQYATPWGSASTCQRTDKTSGIRQIGFYAQDQIKWGNLNLQIGGRYDRAKTTHRDPLAYSNNEQTLSNGKFTWRTGALYQFDNGISPYVSYSTSFVPAIGLDNQGNMLKPTTAAQTELGVKYQPSGHENILLTASVFQIKQKNLSTLDYNSQYQLPDGSGKWSSGISSIGKSRTRGAEIEFQGDITPAWGVSGSYTYLDQKVLEAASDFDGQGSSVKGKTNWGLPKHSASLWADYRVQKGALRGLSVGTGVRYQSQTWGNNTNTFRVPSFALWDMKVGYRLGEQFKSLRGATVQLNVQNLTDKKYVASCADDFACFYGTGRKAIVSLGYRW